MKLNLTSVIMLFGLAIAAISEATQEQGRSVISHVLDTDATNQPYRIRSDSSYSQSTTYFDSIDSVRSIFQASDEWELNTVQNSSRKFFIDFGDPGEGVYSGHGAPFDKGLMPGRFVTKCYEKGNQIGYPTVGNMLGNRSQLICSAIFRFDVSTEEYYQLRFGAFGERGTDYIQIECMNAESNDLDSPCVRWQIMPAGEEGRGLARLVKLMRKGQQLEDTPLGYYYFTFRVVVEEFQINNGDSPLGNHERSSEE